MWGWEMAPTLGAGLWSGKGPELTLPLVVGSGSQELEKDSHLLLLLGAALQVGR